MVNFLEYITTGLKSGRERLANYVLIPGLSGGTVKSDEADDGNTNLKTDNQVYINLLQPAVYSRLCQNCNA